MSSGPIIFGQPWFDEEEERLVLQTLRSGWIGQGPLVELFERRLGEYLGAPHVVAVSSCTEALHLALVALDVGPGDEVVTTPFTFVATLNAIEHTGATPVLVDIERDTLNITPEAVETVLTDRTRAVMPVHFGGRPVDVAGFQALCERHDVHLVEDAAHAVGAVADGRRIGGSGHPRALSCFSFYPNKNLASAEGGAIALADDATADRLRTLRLHGLDNDAWKRYRTDAYRPSLAVNAGFKANWTDLQAAIALGQLTKLEGFLAVREYLAARYDELLAGAEGVMPVDRGVPSATWRHALHLYQVAIAGPAGSRDAVLRTLREQQIGAAVHYLAAPLHPVYANRFRIQDLPAADWASDALLTLPLHPHLSDDDVERVGAALRLAAATPVRAH